MTVADELLVGVTHPFHPQFGRRLPCVGRRYNCYGERLLLQGSDGTVWSIPPQWSDLVDEAPEVVMGGGQALFRLSDLMELADLVARMIDEPARSCTAGCKVDYAGSVKGNTPHGDRNGW